MLAVLVAPTELRAQLSAATDRAGATQPGSTLVSVVETMWPRHAAIIVPQASVGSAEAIGWSVLSRTQSDHKIRSARHGYGVLPLTLGMMGLNHRWHQGAQHVRFAPGSMPWALNKGTAGSALDQESQPVNFLALSRRQWKGLGIGVLAGAVVGGLGGLTDGGDSEGLIFGEATAGEKALIGAIGGGVLGGLIGLIVASL